MIGAGSGADPPSPRTPHPVQTGGVHVTQKEISAELHRDIPACPYVEMVGRMTYELRRANRYLALFTGYEVPLVWELEGPSVPNMSGWQDGTLTSARRAELPSEVEGVYQSADALLRAFPDDSYVGKAIESIGASSLSNDLDMAYVNAWNGIELLAKEYRYESNPGIPRLTSDGQRDDPKRVGKVVKAFIDKFHDGPIPPAVPPDLDWLEYLRNGSAHGGLSNYPGKTFGEYWERWDKGEAIRDLAFEVLINYLSERGIIPPVPRPVRRRVLVPSFRPDWKVTPVDETSKLSARGQADGPTSRIETGQEGGL